jgi:hypothetical protein
LQIAEKIYSRESWETGHGQRKWIAVFSHVITGGEGAQQNLDGRQFFQLVRNGLELLLF